MMESSFLKGTVLKERKWDYDFLFDFFFFKTMKIEHLQGCEGEKELEN